MQHPTTTLTSLTSPAIWLTAAAARRRPRIGPLRDGAGAGRFQHSEWSALLGRFVRDGRVEYDQLLRVRRLVEAYLSRLAEIDPETFIDADDQLACYLNAYNAIAIHQVLRHYPISSIRAIPQAFARPYPIGRRNESLHTLHGGVLRAFGDPRIHVAICAAAMGSPTPAAFTGADLQRALDGALRRFLADPERGARYEAATNTVYLSAIFRVFGGDFLRPDLMPRLRGLIVGWSRPRALLAALQPYVPPPIAAALPARPTLAFLPFRWELNQTPPTAPTPPARVLR